MKHDEFIFGKDQTERVVAVELDGNNLHIFQEDENGITETVRQAKNPYWILYNTSGNQNYGRLTGDLHYKYFNNLETEQDYKDELQSLYRYKSDFFTVRDHTNRVMVKEGITLFLGLKIPEVSVLSFDIETSGLVHNETSTVFMISNTYKKGDNVVRKTYTLDNFNSQKEMIDEWTKWVRQMDPSIITGHNVFGFDFPYLEYCSGGLNLGRDGSRAVFSYRPSQFRKDGSQSYDYKNIKIFGRQIIDTMFSSIKYYTGRQLDSYALKSIIKFEGLEVENRVHYPAEKIGHNWVLPEEREKIIKYAEQDADDALKLYEITAPTYFYLCQSIPMSFQMIINRASGSQINAFMIRSYLQSKHSIPKASERETYRGAISFATPGMYKNVFSVDFHALYPSIIRQYKIFDKQKDPLGNMLKMMDYFADQRVIYKKQFEETGDDKYDGMQRSAKIVANSVFGFMGAPGLNFNTPRNMGRILLIARCLLNRISTTSTGKGIEKWIV